MNTDDDDDDDAVMDFLLSFFSRLKNKDTLSKMGMCVTAYSSAKRKHHLLSRQQQHIKRLLTEPVKEDEQITGTHQLRKSSDIIGDNIDVTRSPTQMSVDRKQQNWHWFLRLTLEKKSC